MTNASLFVRFIHRNKYRLLSIFLGGVAGYLYYHFRACPNGTCMITSRPLNSILYGMVMGFLLQNIVRSEKKIHPKSNSR